MRQQNIFYSIHVFVALFLLHLSAHGHNPRTNENQTNHLYERHLTRTVNIDISDPKPPAYVPDELLVKFSNIVSNSLEAGLKTDATAGQMLSGSALEHISKKYEVLRIEPIFKDYKKQQARLQLLSQSNWFQLGKSEQHILKRLQRAPQNVSVPALDRIYKLKIALEDNQTLEQVAAAYNSNPEVEYAELNYIVSINLTPNDPHYSIQWPLNNTGQMYPASGGYNDPPGTVDADIDAPEAWDIHNGSSSDIIVAVVDTGIDYNHRDLTSNIWVNNIEANGNSGVDDDGNGYVDDVYGYDFINNDYNPIDDHGHGTHCAGIISASTHNNLDIAGVCWSARIMGLKFLGNTGSGPTSEALEAFYYAVHNGADIISNSWGGGGFMQSAQDAIDYACSQGVILVASAGNDDSDEVNYPANYNHMISVAATDSNDTRASFSSYGEWVDLAAPGVDVLSLRAAGTSMGTPYDNYTTIASGTSMACPHVAGACALLLSFEPALSRDNIYDILMNSGDPIADGICLSDSRLNLTNSLNLLLSSEGSIYIEHFYYSCSDLISLSVIDSDLAGHGTQAVIINGSGGDTESILLMESAPYIGVFRGTIPTSGDQIDPNDGTLQLSHLETITAIYQDTNDGSGGPAVVTDSAVADCELPSLSNLAIDIPGPDPVVTFQTSEPAKIQLLCSTSCGGSYEIILNSMIPKTEHVFEITGIAPSTTYYYIIKVWDQVDNLLVDDNDGACYSFTSTTPADIYVPADANTIQKAIDYCWDGQTVWVANGTYTGAGNKNINFMGRAITLAGINGPANCIIDCEDTHRGFIFDRNENGNSIIDGFTIINGYGSKVCLAYGCEYRAGGIYCDSGTSPTISNCVVKDCWAHRGGGIYVNGGSPTVKHCQFINNHASNGGGIYSFSGATFINCVIKNNIGGGVYGSNLTLVNCLIEGNTRIHSSGGGIVAHYSTGDNTITNCTIINNSTNETGGGILVYCSNAIITNSILWNNTGDDGGDQISTWGWSWGAHADVNVSHSNIQGGAPDIYVRQYSTLHWQEGNIQADPFFLANVPQQYKYHLANDSPCVDTGTNTPPGGLEPNDLDDLPRITDGNGDAIATVDMGCYEYNPNMSPVLFRAPTDLEFITSANNNPPTQSFSIHNSGGRTLNWSIQETCSWLSVSLDSGQSTGAPQEVTVTIDVAGLVPGEYNYPITISSSNAINSPLIVDVTLFITAIYCVPGEYSTIQAAVNAVTVDHFTILVADGEYIGPGNTNIDFQGKIITLRSENGPANCIINCQNSHRAFIFDNSESSEVILGGFTIRNGYAVDGGAIYCDSSPTIIYCIFENNSASDDGGAIFSYGGNPHITKCVFNNNDCTDFGGAISTWSGRPKINNCTFTNNHANRGGGILYQSSKNTDIINCIFIGNSASRGGGICYQASKDYNMLIKNCTFVNNTNEGVRLYWSTGTVKDCIFWDNPGIDIKLTQGLSDPDYKSVLYISHTDIQGGIGSISKDSYCTIHWEVGNIDADPIFTSGLGGNYYLSQTLAGQLSNSPCLNAGSNTAKNCLMHLSSTRTDGVADRNMVDIGYHYPLYFSDFDGDGIVRLDDYAILNSDWLQHGYNLSTDIAPLGGDGHTDMLDLIKLTEDWLLQK
jgi:parallel beta-helix repeat protein